KGYAWWKRTKKQSFYFIVSRNAQNPRRWEFTDTAKKRVVMVTIGSASGFPDGPTEAKQVAVASRPLTSAARLAGSTADLERVAQKSVVQATALPAFLANFFAGTALAQEGRFTNQTAPTEIAVLLDEKPSTYGLRLKKEG